MKEPFLGRVLKVQSVKGSRANLDIGLQRLLSGRSRRKYIVSRIDELRLEDYCDQGSILS